MIGFAIHEIVKCSCGVVLWQCRCADGNKKETTIPHGCDKCANLKRAQSPDH